MTKRQKEILQKIIDFYIENGVPVGSKNLIIKYNLKLSSATIRSEMVILEKEGFLEKSHISSGRIPSIKGYRYYANKVVSKNNNNLEIKLIDIFAKRRAAIDFTIEEAAKAITNIVGLTLVTSDSEIEELMKSIQLTPIDEKMATVVIVTSVGKVYSKIITFNSYIKIEDVRIAIRLFKERLVDTKLKDLAAKVELLTPILSKNIKNYESIIQDFVNKVFDFHQKITNKIYGNKNIVKSDIKREDLAQLLELMQSTSIFSSIEGKLDEDENIKIDIRPNNTSILSTKINHHNKTTEVSVIGSNRMNYANAKKAIELMKKFLGEKK